MFKKIKFKKKKKVLIENIIVFNSANLNDWRYPQVAALAAPVLSSPKPEEGDTLESCSLHSSGALLNAEQTVAK